MRGEIAALADGTYEAMDVVDGFGDEPEPIEIRVTLTIRATSSRSTSPGRARRSTRASTAPLGLIHAACYCAIRGIVQATSRTARATWSRSASSRRRARS